MMFVNIRIQSLKLKLSAKTGEDDVFAAPRADTVRLTSASIGRRNEITAAMFLGATELISAGTLEPRSTVAQDTRLKTSAAFAYRIGGSAGTPARSQIRPVHGVSPRSKPIRPEKGRVQLTEKNVYHHSIMFSKKNLNKKNPAAVLTVKDTIQLKVDRDVFCYDLCLKGQAKG